MTDRIKERLAELGNIPYTDEGVKAVKEIILTEMSEFIAGAFPLSERMCHPINSITITGVMTLDKRQARRFKRRTGRKYKYIR